VGAEEGIAYAGIKRDMIQCGYTDAGASATVAVIGDSHACAAYSGIAKLGKTLGYNTIVMGKIVPASELMPEKKYAELKTVSVIFDVIKRKNDIKKYLFHYAEICI
jgi:hypothetical protein